MWTRYPVCIDIIQIYLEVGKTCVLVCEERSAGVARENLLDQEQEPTTNSTHI